MSSEVHYACEYVHVCMMCLMDTLPHPGNGGVEVYKLLLHNRNEIHNT